MSAKEARERGSAAYKRGDYTTAVREFSEAISTAEASDSQLHIYHSNRCAAYLELGKVSKTWSTANKLPRNTVEEWFTVTALRAVT